MAGSTVRWKLNRVRLFCIRYKPYLYRWCWLYLNRVCFPTVTPLTRLERINVRVLGLLYSVEWTPN